MGMQVHFNLADALHSAVVAIRRDDDGTYTGVVDHGGVHVTFNIMQFGGESVSNDCWRDVVGKRDVIHWLIDNRIPFRCS